MEKMSKTNYRVVGIDVGNGLTNVRSVYPDGSKYILTLPSIYNYASNEGHSLGFMSDSSLSLDHITVDGVEYIWGEDIAYIENHIETASPSEGRYKTSNFKTFVKIILGKVARDIQIKPDEKILIATGVPSSQTEKEEAVEGLKKAFLGEEGEFQGLHKVEVEGEQYIINVSNVIVTSQPLATVFGAYLDDEGTVADPTIPQKKIGVVDIGGGTTDLDTILPNLRRAPRPHSEDSGFNDVYTAIREHISNENNAQIKVNDYILLDIINKAEAKAKEEGKEPVYIFKGSDRQKEVDFTKVYKNALVQLGRTINGAIFEQWKDFKSFDIIFMTGGSAERVAPYVEILDEPVFPEDTGLSNVEGYYRYGRAFLHKLLQQAR